jgi:hypothetical protein
LTRAVEGGHSKPSVETQLDELVGVLLVRVETSHIDHTRESCFSVVREMQDGWYRIVSVWHFDAVGGMTSRAQGLAVCLNLQAKRIVFGIWCLEVEILGEMSAKGCSDAKLVAGGLRFGLLGEGIEGAGTACPVAPPL